MRKWLPRLHFRSTPKENSNLDVTEWRERCRRDINNRKAWQYQPINRAGNIWLYPYAEEVLTCILSIESDVAKSLMSDSNDVMPLAITVSFTSIISGGNFHWWPLKGMNEWIRMFTQTYADICIFVKKQFTNVNRILIQASISNRTQS